MCSSFAKEQTEHHMRIKVDAEKKAKEAAARLRGESLVVSIQKFLHRTRALMLEREGVEVEARIGVLCEPHFEVGSSSAPRRLMPSKRGCGAVASTGSFVPGVALAVARSASATASRLGTRVESSESTFGSEAKALEGARLVVPSDASRATRLEIKTTLDWMDLGLPSAQYDVRLMVSVEAGEGSLGQEALKALSPTNKALGPWTWRRHKQRVSTTWGSWRIDETTVTRTTYLGLTTDQATAIARRQQPDSPEAPTSVVREIEVELAPEAAARWQREDRLEDKLAVELGSLLLALNPTESVDTRRDPSSPASPETAEAIVARLKESLGRASRFPGSMPAGFARRHIKDAQAPEAYAVAEKSDGERRLLVVLDERRAALIDRAEDVRLVALSPSALDTLRPGTVIDGEIVHNLEHRISVFLVFDVLHDGRENLTRRAFDDRFFGALKTVLAPALAVPCPGLDDDHVDHSSLFRDALAKAPGALLLVPKRFSRPRDLKRHVLSKIKRDADYDGQVKFGARVFREDSARCHLTDGLVFVPRKGEYVSGSDPTLLKWKWKEGLTVDLEVRGAGKGGDLSPCAVGDDGEPVDCSKHVSLDSFDQARLRADLYFYHAPLVAELGLDPTSGFWEYHGPRPDKTHANHFDVFVSTLLLHAESPDEPELEYRLRHPSPDKDDWHALVAKAMAAATNPWTENFSKSFKRPYWFNKFNGKTTWDKPPELAALGNS
ncbi:hypothetical protein CTAYLR_006903 [Chrysophaeum taylorii]|uniref:mRNA 5'-phosphatase n=1 Tax=Chrysophaeum taylorii TaxID=2483200 RepID=A0AAD7UI14_9STRA|nr:hypothetical protein CTAYLR_006903 [Chrysophaeum taylorii]